MYSLPGIESSIAPLPEPLFYSNVPAKYCNHSRRHSTKNEYSSLRLQKDLQWRTAITGHRKDKSFEKYLHIYEQMAIESRESEEAIDIVV